MVVTLQQTKEMIKQDLKELMDHLQLVKGLIESNLNPKIENYKNWSPESIVKYVISLDKGIYKPYAEPLLEALKQNQMTGEDLPELNKNDLFSFGVKIFRHRVALIRHFQKLAGNDYIFLVKKKILKIIMIKMEMLLQLYHK